MHVKLNVEDKGMGGWGGGGGWTSGKGVRL